MLTWSSIVIAFAAMLAGGGALYVHLRWYRSPQAYRAMFALAASYFVAGALAGGWLMRVASPKPAASVAPSTAYIPSIPAPVASAAAAAGTALSSPLNHFSAKVVSITDGDTVDVLAPGNLTYAVRLAGIDAPEPTRLSEPNQLSISARCFRARQSCWIARMSGLTAG